jgi:hypothetical protein
VVKGDKYDIADPFIDDSDLIVDEPTYYIRPKKDGFYVQKGVVELMGQTWVGGPLLPVGNFCSTPVLSHARPEKPKRNKVNGGSASDKAGRTDKFVVGNGIIKKRKKQPIGLGFRPGAPPTQKKSLDLARPIGAAKTIPSTPTTTSRPAAADTGPPQATVANGSAQVIDVDALPDRPPPPVIPTTKEDLWPLFTEEVRQQLDAIVRQKELEDFTVKKNFPERLKPMVRAAGEKAIDGNCFGEDFFRALSLALPYNKFTMKVGFTGMRQPWTSLTFTPFRASPRNNNCK